MARSRVLVDSSFLYALFDEDDNKHAAAYLFSQADSSLAVVPDIVLVEVMLLVDRAGGVPAAVRFLDFFSAAPFQLEPIIPGDLKRVREITFAYSSSRFDFVDCCVMALAERLEITHICMFDRRDFSIFRPRNCDFYDLLP